VSNQLMADIWFRGVQWSGWVTNVLGGVEHPEGKPGQEISRW
jgi:hypothetical protein